jgi:hypothetical protein
VEELLKDILDFLQEPEHEIVRTYSEDNWKESIYCGLALGWEQERDNLIQRIQEALAE